MSEIIYQEDGAERIYKSLFEERNTRYLLADEVGLGKTIIAARVIAKIYENSSNQPVRIGYICGNKALAKQNIRKLKERINEALKDDEKISFDTMKRQELLSLAFLDLQEENNQKKEIALYTVTPSTSINVLF